MNVSLDMMLYHHFLGNRFTSFQILFVICQEVGSMERKLVLGFLELVAMRLLPTNMMFLG
jgi:translation initiation factor 2 beta subunit (eIF-2beta)/eIF-5